ncbi:MAG: sodium-dependent transporter [Candidatus Porifericomitaceae bacterium WSBS_2022_MAG_OTU9]
MATSSIHGEWSTRWAFILAASGAAIGLGNIWRFPYILGENGGGAFVLVYLCCILFVSLPIVISEVLIGHCGRHSPVRSLQTMLAEHRLSKGWSVIGWSGMLVGILILSYYSVIAGWVLHYIGLSFTGWTEMTPEAVATTFDVLQKNYGTKLILHTIFIVMTCIVVGSGVQSGLERGTKFMMPTLLVLMILMILYNATLDGFGAGVEYLFKPDFSVFVDKPDLLLVAMGQAFFSLSIGMGALMAYGAYLPKQIKVGPASCYVALADTGIAILAGLMIFPLVFTYMLEPASGVGLIFKVLPLAFSQMPGGYIFSISFFILLIFAAWTSSISLIEPATAWLSERSGWTRRRAIVFLGLFAWLLGIASVWSGKFLGLVDGFASNIMLPLGGMLIALFVGWRLPTVVSHVALGFPGWLYKSWLWSLRVVAPAGVGYVFLTSLFS